MIRVICDICERPMPLTEIEGVETVVLHNTKEWNTKTLFPYLCEKCAAKLDSALLKMKTDMNLQQHYAERFAWLNAKRRGETGSKG